jgi:hypothetical protein
MQKNYLRFLEYYSTIFTRLQYTMFHKGLQALSSPAERRCFPYDSGKPAAISSILLSNNGDAFVVVVDNNSRYLLISYISMITTHHFIIQYLILK